MKLSRRNVLIAGGVVGLAPAFIAGRAVARRAEDTIVEQIRSTTGNTTISEANLYQFAEKFVAVHRPMFGRKFDAMMVIMDNGWSASLLPRSRRSVYEWLERSLLTDFLFSTDFFTSGGQDLKRMAYVDYADPYTLGCRNPLAQFGMEA